MILTLFNTMKVVQNICRINKNVIFADTIELTIRSRIKHIQHIIINQ